MALDRPALDRPRYRRISIRLWGDEKFRQLSAAKPNAQTLWLFLLTGPHTQAVPGLFSAGEAQLAERLQWSRRGFRKAWDELEGHGMVRADWRAHVVFVPNAVHHNAPESPNFVRSWKIQLADLPECALKNNALLSLATSCSQFGPGFAEAFEEISGQKCPDRGGKTFGKPSLKPSGKALPNQEQEQEQEQDGKAAAAPDRFELQHLVELWNELAAQAGLARVQSLTASRRKHGNQRLQEQPERAYWERVVHRIGASAFCRGGNARGWKADFDFLLKPDTHVKVIEDKYADAPPARAGEGSPRPRDCDHEPRCQTDRIHSDLMLAESRIPKLVAV